MSTEAELREESDRGERRETAFYVALPFVLLGVSTLLALLQVLGGEQVDVAAALALSLVTTTWLLWPSRVRRVRPESGRVEGVYYLGLLALGAGLVAVSSWYGIFAFTGYAHAFLLLRGWWRYIGVAGTSMIMSVAYMGGVPRIGPDEWWLWAAISAVTTLLAGASFSFATINDQQGRRQRRALAELQEANVKLATALDENAGLHAQLLVQAREAGVTDERQRMARDIHDTLAQSLAGILTQLQAAEESNGEEPSADASRRRHLRNARELAREGLTEARRTVRALGPHALTAGRLPEAIGDVARRWSEVAGVDAVLSTTGEVRPMHPDVEIALLRAAQEALANVAKHASASRVVLTLSYMEDLVTLDVRDDGVGFAVDAGDPLVSGDGGFGLAAMRHRVNRLAGRLEIESEPGGGTAISASVPAIPVGGGR